MAGLFERSQGKTSQTAKASPAQEAIARFLLARLANPPSFAGHVSGHDVGPSDAITADLMNVLLQPGSMDRTTEGTMKPPGASMFEQAMQGLQGLLMLNSLVRGGGGGGGGRGDGFNLNFLRDYNDGSYGIPGSGAE